MRTFSAISTACRNFSLLSLPFVAWVVPVPDRWFSNRLLRGAAYGLYVGFISFLIAYYQGAGTIYRQRLNREDRGV